MRRPHPFRKSVTKRYYRGLRMGAAAIICFMAALCLVSCAGRQGGSGEEFYSRFWDAETAVRQREEDEALRAAARKMGTDPFPEIADLEKELEEYNSLRAGQREDGQVVYGLEEYDILTYYNFCRYQYESELLLRIQEDIMENRREELRDRYDRAEDADLTGERRAVLEKYVIEPEEFTEHPKEAEAEMERLEQTVAEQGRLTEEQLQRAFTFPVAVSEITLESETISREDSVSAALLELAWEMGAEGVFRYQLSEGSAYECIYYVVLAEAGERPDFEQAAAGIAMDCAAEELDRLLGRGQE